MSSQQKNNFCSECGKFSQASKAVPKPVENPRKWLYASHIDRTISGQAVTSSTLQNYFWMSVVVLARNQRCYTIVHFIARASPFLPYVCYYKIIRYSAGQTLAPPAGSYPLLTIYQTVCKLLQGNSGIRIRSK